MLERKTNMHDVLQKVLCPMPVLPLSLSHKVCPACFSNAMPHEKESLNVSIQPACLCVEGVSKFVILPMLQRMC